ncbi:helix-turn-helix domain-containing protein [Bartonella raoultii]|uniref:Helix-turn-helix domain-containing protein n=1 Tax=Bartonella raoultii TaxID=1457020 RepID=A0ABS7IA40_9HYPH|nr:helix-turn-helix transcriptional regulator [Bartonella raoultii]MBX4336036.1 helix-turn-helix domain-containing protein [Bartonella raoultii]
MNKIEAKKLRKCLNLTQDEMAALLGVNKSTVWRWEKYGVPSRGTVSYLLETLWNKHISQMTKFSKSPRVDSACDRLQP